MKKYLRDTSNFISFAVALIPSILLYIFQPTNSVPYSIFVITVLLLMLTIWLSAKLYLDLRNSEYPTIEIFKCASGKCLCKPSPYLSHNSLVSFFKTDNDFEEFFCHGYVEVVTQKGMIQIIVLDEEGHNYYDYISKHQSNIIIKPTISIDSNYFEH